MQRDSEVRWYHGFIRPKHMLGASFLFHRELRSYEIKNAPHGSHCGGVEAAAEAARRRRRILPNRIFYIADGYVWQSRCLTRKHGGVGERNVEGGNGMRKISGNKLLVKALKEEGVDTLFGYPGACTIDISDELYKQGDIKVILPRHEQALVHEADAYARSTGKVGVCLVTSGPGATNLVTGLATANYDSVPLVCFTGQVARHLIGNDAFQEVDIVGITRSITKYGVTVHRREELGRIIKEAFYIARSGMQNMYRKNTLFVHRQLPVRMALNAHISTLPVRFVFDYSTNSFYRKDIF